MKIAMIVDASGSMLKDTHRTLDGVNEYISKLRADKNTRKAKLTLSTFNDIHGVKTVHNNVSISSVKDFTLEDYRCAGMTPLFDAIGKTIAVMDNKVRAKDKALFIIMTDGLENASKEYKESVDISRMMREREAKGNWTFVFLGADIDAWTAQSGMGLNMSAGNTVSYDKLGTRAAMHKTAADTVALASAGRMSTDKFSGDG
jgi:Mg-chelatase subunit ChlD